MVTWEKKEGGIYFYVNNIPAARIETPDDTEDNFIRKGQIIYWERKTAVPADSMIMEINTLFQAEHSMVPAISYDGNPWGNDHEYKGFETDGMPYSFAYHRCAVPGATCSWNERISLALFGERHCSGSLKITGQGASHRLLWPETESPRVLYAGRWGGAYYGRMEPACIFKAWLCFGDTKGKEAWKQMLQTVWRQNYKPLYPVRCANQVWKLSADYAHKLYTEEADGFNGFSIGFTWNGTDWVKRPELKYEIGWCGQNASLAVSMLYDYQMYGDKRSLETGLRVLDCWLKKARSRTGLLLTRYDPPGMLIDACNLGTAGLQLFEAYAQANRLGIKRQEYFDAAIEICDFAMARQRLDGGIGMSWNPDGTVQELRGTAGAFLVLPLAAAFMGTGKRKYIIAAVRAYSYYYREFKNNGYGTSGALDTCCIDKESVIPLLKGGLLLYHATGFKTYLDMAGEAAWYLSTWQWHYSVDYPKDSVLGRLSYDTFGGTGVSTSHHHMDAFALCYVPDLLELAKETGCGEWKERALAIWYNGVQGISDGSLVISDTAPRPAGSSDEGYLHTRWGNPEDDLFRVSQWLVAWPCAFRMEVLRKCDNWSLLDGCSNTVPGEVLEDRRTYR